MAATRKGPGSFGVEWLPRELETPLGRWCLVLLATFVLSWLRLRLLAAALPCAALWILGSPWKDSAGAEASTVQQSSDAACPAARAAADGDDHDEGADGSSADEDAAPPNCWALVASVGDEAGSGSDDDEGEDDGASAAGRQDHYTQDFWSDSAATGSRADGRQGGSTLGREDQGEFRRRRVVGSRAADEDNDFDPLLPDPSLGDYGTTSFGSGCGGDRFPDQQRNGKSSGKGQGKERGRSKGKEYDTRGYAQAAGAPEAPKTELEEILEEALGEEQGPMRPEDFDAGAKRFLDELMRRDRASGTRKAVAALEMLFEQTRHKERDEVRKWPAYICTLLQRLDPKLVEELNEQELERRFQERSRR
mmetsp:Transcript_178848/g.573172  ORF Transcript_178848/g.573172 Transcript_178848/m.573172 type:complete len:364 (-) Transcript_178848:198-1289(-)